MNPGPNLLAGMAWLFAGPVKVVVTVQQEAVTREGVGSPSR